MSHLYSNYTLPYDRRTVMKVVVGQIIAMARKKNLAGLYSQGRGGLTGQVLYDSQYSILEIFYVFFRIERLPL